MGIKCKNIFSEECYGAHRIMQLKCLTLCTPLAFLGWVKMPDIKTVQISII